MSYQVPSYVLHHDDEQEIRDRYWGPGPGDRVIDVGSRYGSYTLPALAAGAHVTAVDPHQPIMALLRSAVEVNGFGGRFEWVCAAALDGDPYPEQLTAEIGERWPAGDVQFTRLDWIADDDRINWIKIDVEGVELQVLKGARRTLARDRPKLLIEDHTRVYPWCEQNRIRRKVQTFLERLGYAVNRVPYEQGDGADRDFIIAT